MNSLHVSIFCVLTLDKVYVSLSGFKNSILSLKQVKLYIFNSKPSHPFLLVFCVKLFMIVVI